MGARKDETACRFPRRQVKTLMQEAILSPRVPGRSACASGSDLVDDLEGAYSRRINIQHRLVYQVDKDARVVKVLRLWTHYESPRAER